ncbi:hypothetical protein SDC9_109017 [bioreactor metagenome]|uniref:Uncharacterized protein n=1 Tax=bioreactor metagenome TaxID=1076179 RepID=A0A645BBW4_9ZZZZ
MDQVQQTAWRPNNYIHTAIKAIFLGDIRLSTVHSQNSDISFLRKRFCCFGNLLGKLTGGGQDQSLNRFPMNVQILQQWQHERSGFTRSGLCLSDQIASL